MTCPWPPPRLRTPISSSSPDAPADDRHGPEPATAAMAGTAPDHPPDHPPGRESGTHRAALLLAQRRVRAVHLRAAARAAAAHRVDHRQGVPAWYARRGADDLRTVDHRVRGDRRRLREPRREASDAAPRRRAEADQDHPAAGQRIPVRSCLLYTSDAADDLLCVD